MDWPDNHPDDLDLMVQDPRGNVAWYRHKEAGFLTLDRDDRGGLNDTIVVNVQGDEPLIDPALVSGVAAHRDASEGCAIATAAHPIADPAEPADG